MLHIIKQFTFGLTMGLKNNFESNSWGNESQDSIKTPETNKEELLNIFDTFNTDNNDILNYTDELFDGSDQLKDELINALIDLWYNEDTLSSVLHNGILISDIKNKIEEKFSDKDNITETSVVSLSDLKTDLNIEQYNYSLKYLKWLVLQEGNSSDKILLLKSIFQSLGYDVDYNSSKSDRKFDNKLTAAIKEFQSLNNLTDDGIFWNNTLTALKNIKSSRDVNIKSTNSELVTAKNIDVVNNVTPQSQEKTNNVMTTKEKWVEWWKESFIWIEYAKLSKSEILQDIDRVSLTKLLKQSNISDLVEQLKSILGTENINTFTYNNVLGFRNYSKTIPILEGLWYKVKWGFLGTVEALGVIWSINGVNETQKNIENLNFRDKLAIIFDYNTDGLLDNEAEFYTKEKEIFNAVQTEEHFENILKNLWYTDKKQFDSEFNENYYSARENFKNMLAISLDWEYVLDPGLMMTNPDAKKQLNEQLQNINDQVKEDFTMNEKVQKMSSEYPELAEQFQKNTQGIARQVYLQSVSWVVWGALGAAATFNVSNITKQIIDNASIWMVNGVLGLQLGKEVFRSSDDKTAASVWFVNFIPYISASHASYEEKVSGLENIFQTEKLENGMKLNIWASVSVWAGVIWVNYEKVDEKTQEWREQLKKQMTTMLSSVIDNINDEKDFSDLSMEESEENKKYYEQIKALYLATWGNEIAKSEIVNWAANLYERMLAEENEGFTLNGVTLVAIYTTLLWAASTIWVHGEYSSMDWEKRNFVISQLEGQSNFTIERGNFTTIERMNKLDTNLAQYESAFSGKTRWNDTTEKWKGFLDPENTIEQRWDAIKNMASFVGDLEEVKLWEFLSLHDKESDAVKLAIISTLWAWTRKSFDVKESDTPQKLVELDKNRRAPFNEMFGFDTSKYASAYYDVLSEQETINSTTQYGTSFDAISALNVWGASEKQSDWSMSNRVSGIDMLHGSIDMVADKDNNPIQIEITDNADKLAFANNVRKLANNHWDALHALAEGIENGSISLYFYKDPDGFNDRILPVVNSVEAQENISVDVYNPVYDVKAWSLFALGHEDEKESNDDQSSTPDFDENNTNAWWNWIATNQWATRWTGNTIDNTNIPNQVVSSNNIETRQNINMKNAWATILTHDINGTNSNR